MTATATSIGQHLLGQYCLVRTAQAGVFAGTLLDRSADEALLGIARRIWYWDGAASLSQLATDGTKKPRECKFPAPVSQVLLAGVIEILPVTDKARTSIEQVPAWSA